MTPITIGNNIYLMPIRKKYKKQTASRSHSAPWEFSVFTDNKLKLQLIVLAFLAVSSLLTIYMVSQQEELNFYRRAAAVTASK